MPTLRFHAIYAALNDAILFDCSVRSIYAHVSGITVVTGYDRDWHGAAVAPDNLVSRILDRRSDPEEKIELVVARESSEPRARNRAMDLAARPPRSNDTKPFSGRDRRPPPPDYFWIVDADEIYESAAIERLHAYVAKRRSRAYRVAFHTYFKAWNYRIRSLGWATTFVRADQRLHAVRNIRTSALGKVAFRVPGLSYEQVHRLSGATMIPASVGAFHHGSYVGPDERIVRKTTAGGHSDAMRASWVDDVWNRWTPSTTDFHPTHPEMFDAVDHIPTAALPVEISRFDWPEGYLLDDARGGAR